MPITVCSPHSGRPVKVRDQDVGRAVRDEEGRIFYVLPKDDSSGHYGALTRTGSAKNEKLATELHKSLGVNAPQVRADGDPHNATGRVQPSRHRRILILSLLLIVVALAYIFGWLWLGQWSTPSTLPPPSNEASATGDDRTPAVRAHPDG